MSIAKKASTTKSTGKSAPVDALLNANSKGDDHAEYTTSTTRNACHNLHLPKVQKNKNNIFCYNRMTSSVLIYVNLLLFVKNKTYMCLIYANNMGGDVWVMRIGLCGWEKIINVKRL